MPCAPPTLGAGFLNESSQGCRDARWRAVVRILGREEDHVVSVQWQSAFASSFTQHALAPVSIDCVSQPLRRDEGDPSGAALVKLSHSNAQERIVEPLPTREDLLEISLRFDGLLHCI